MNDWLRRYHPKPAADTILVCFPHAGGSASYFRELSAQLPAAVELLAVQYPGRQDRRLDPMIDDVSVLAEQVMPSVLELTNRPVALFGHSLGSCVAFEVARGMERRGVRPVGLFASARRPPSLSHAESTHLAGDQELVAAVTALGGRGSELLADPEMAELLLPTIRNDYRAAENYRCAEDAAVRCPVVALLGDADPKVSPEEARGWARHTSGGFEMRVFPGGHFYSDEHIPALAGAIVAELATVRTSAE